MKYFLLALCSIATLLLTACSFLQQEKLANEWNAELPSIIEQQETEIEAEPEETSPSWIPEGYTGAIAVITEANSGDIIIQTGDQLLYRNEIYGFQILLGKEWKGGKICKEDDKGIDFFLSWEVNENEVLIQNPFQDKTSCRSLGYTPYSYIEILTHEAYEKLKQKFEQLQNDKWRDLLTYRINNKYRFRFIQVTFWNTLKLLLPNAECKDIIVPAWEGEIEYELYRCTEIEESQLILSGFSTFDL